MPAPGPAFILTPPKTPFRVALEPAHNAIYSLILLNQADSLSGLDDWIMQTAASLSPERVHTNKLVLEGLFYAVVPTRSWPTFLAYVNHLEGQTPTTLRDNLLNAYIGFSHYALEKGEKHPIFTEAQSPDFDPVTVLDSPELFLEFLQGLFSAEHINLMVEREAYALLKDPPAMQAVIISHLRTMWQETLAPEWERSLPLLQTCIEAFNQIDFSQLTALEAARLVKGQELPEWWESALTNIDPSETEIIFVPTTHIGPYLGKFKNEQTLWFLFGARLPDGTRIYAPELSRSELLVRLSALADDTRLRILRLLAAEGELCSQDIMQRLDLSQSAVSRHLKQLSATSYLIERRREGAKCYELNPKRIKDTFRALLRFLQVGD